MLSECLRNRSKWCLYGKASYTGNPDMAGSRIWLAPLRNGEPQIGESGNEMSFSHLVLSYSFILRCSSIAEYLSPYPGPPNLPHVSKSRYKPGELFICFSLYTFAI